MALSVVFLFIVADSNRFLHRISAGYNGKSGGYNKIMRFCNMAAICCLSCGALMGLAI